MAAEWKKCTQRKKNEATLPVFSLFAFFFIQFSSSQFLFFCRRKTVNRTDISRKISYMNEASERQREQNKITKKPEKSKLHQNNIFFLAKRNESFTFFVWRGFLSFSIFLRKIFILPCGTFFCSRFFSPQWEATRTGAESQHESKFTLFIIRK